MISRAEFDAEFIAFEDALRSYLFRLAANRADAEDLAQATFLRALDKLETFRRDSSLKTWVFAIATNLARDHKRVRRRWREDTQDRCRSETQSDDTKVKRMHAIVASSDIDAYDFREHIDYCFTCIAKTLDLEQQLAIILKDIYQFTVAEVMTILGLTEGKVKHALADGRRTMTDIFDKRCALVNKQGVCYQCSEINGFVNPKLEDHLSLLQLREDHTDEVINNPGDDVDEASESLPNHSHVARTEQLLSLRAALIRNIDPLHVPGADLHAYLLELMDETDRD